MGYFVKVSLLTTDALTRRKIMMMLIAPHSLTNAVNAIHFQINQ